MRLILLFFLFSCANDPKLVHEFIIDQVLPIEEIKGAELIQTENGNIKVKITANNIKRFYNIQPELVFSDNFILTFYSDSSSIESILQADNATIDHQKKIMIASDNVILQGFPYKKLETEELVWNEELNKIYTDKSVKITTNKEIIFGEGFTSNANFSEYSLSKIHGSLSFDPDE